MNIQPSSDVTPYLGGRVVIDRYRSARIDTISHGATGALLGGVGGTGVEDPHGDCRGDSTSFWRPYGTTMEAA